MIYCGIRTVPTQNQNTKKFSHTQWFQPILAKFVGCERSWRSRPKVWVISWSQWICNTAHPLSVQWEKRSASKDAMLKSWNPSGDFPEISIYYIHIYSFTPFPSFSPLRGGFSSSWPFPWFHPKPAGLEPL